MYVQCALDVWTVVDMLVKGPGILGVLWILWSVYSVRCLGAVRMMQKGAASVLVCSGPLCGLAGKITTLLGAEFCKNDVIQMVLWPHMTSSAL